MANWNECFKKDTSMEPNIFLKDMQATLFGKGVTIAEGEGRNAVFLAGQELNVTAWGYAECGLEKVSKLAEKQGVRVNTELVDLAEADWQQNQ